MVRVKWWRQLRSLRFPNNIPWRRAAEAFWVAVVCNPWAQRRLWQQAVAAELADG